MSADTSDKGDQEAQCYCGHPRREHRGGHSGSACIRSWRSCDGEVPECDCIAFRVDNSGWDRYFTPNVGASGE